jgi:hypothetical protein
VIADAMKNVTVTMEDSVADWARMEAARRNTSVSRLVGEMLAEKMRHDDAYERAMREALLFEPLPFEPYASREDIYAERIAFVDTNVLLYAQDVRVPSKQKAAADGWRGAASHNGRVASRWRAPSGRT